MIIEKSPKIFNNYKADYPKNTIARINSAINNLGLKINYYPMENDKSISIFSGRARLENLNVAANGKGTSPILAKASAYAELIERISSGIWLDLSIFKKFIIESKILFRELDINNEYIDKYSNCAYLNGYVKDDYTRIKNKIIINDLLKNISLNKTDIELLRLSELTKHWVDAYSLIKDKYYKVPILLIKRISGSNGLAAGNTLEEAIVQATCEIFERYCLISIIKNKIKTPTINIESIDNKNILDIIKLYNDHNIDIIIKDFSFNNKYPVIAVIFINNNISKDSNIFKKTMFHKRIRVGSHLNLNEALMRCLIEELQGWRFFDYLYHYKDDLLWDYWINKLKNKYIPAHEDYKPLFRSYNYIGELNLLLDNTNKINYDELKSIDNNDFYFDIEEIINICKNNNLDILVIDKTHKKINFPVVRVVIPGISNVVEFYYNSINVNNIINNAFYFNSITIDRIYNFIIGKSWMSKQAKIIELVDILEGYLSGHLNSFGLNLTHFGLKRCRLVLLLGILYLSLKNYKRSLLYFQMANDLSKHDIKLGEMISLLQSNPLIYRKIDILKYKNPFIKKCDCINCAINYPATLYKWIKITVE